MKSKKVLILIGIIVVIIMAIFFTKSFLTKASVVKDGSLDWLRNTKVAHRGLHDNKDIAENSISAIKLTMKENENIEIDVQKTKDNIVVVVHDENLLRLTGVDKQVNDLTYEELRELKLLGTEEYIPTFKEVLELINGKIGILIEVKNEGEAGDLEALTVKELENYKGDFAIQSFNPFVLEWFKINANYIQRGQLAGGYDETNLKDYEKFLLSNLLLNFKATPDFIVYKVEELPKDIVKSLRNKGVLILAWTATSDMDENLLMEVSDNVIYERTWGE